MNNNEIKLHLDSIIETDSANLNALGFAIAACKVWKIVRGIFYIVSKIHPKRIVRLGAEAFIMLCDTNCKKQNGEL